MASDARAKMGIRARIGRVVFKVPVIRHFYARRLLKYMEKARAKRRPLPSQLQELQQLLSRVPRHLQLATLEEALQAPDREPSSRQMRRAASRQQRQGGRHGQRRPGTVMSRQWQPPPPKTPAGKRAKSGRSRG